MQNQIDKCPYIDIKSKADLDFDYETKNLKIENKSDLNTKMYYFDKKTKIYSTFLLIRIFTMR